MASGPASTQSETAQLTEVDWTGISRAIDLIAKDTVPTQVVVNLLRRELAALQHRIAEVQKTAHRSALAARQHAERAQRDRATEFALAGGTEDDDRFIRHLIEEWENQVDDLIRERDTALARVRDLSQELAQSLPNRRSTQRHLNARSEAGSEISPADHDDPRAQLTLARERVEELLVDRERFQRMIRRLTEQRDALKARLEAVTGDSTDERDLVPELPVLPPVHAMENRSGVTGPRISAKFAAPSFHEPLPTSHEPPLLASLPHAQSEPRAPAAPGSFLQGVARVEEEPDPLQGRAGCYSMTAGEIATEDLHHRPLPKPKR